MADINDRVTFDRQSADRIGKAVRKIERTPQKLGGRQQSGDATDTTFWARITTMQYDPPMELTSNAPPPRYSWLRVVPDPTAPAYMKGFAIDQPTVHGDGSAREANASPSVPIGTIVRLTFVGYDSDDEPLYVFAWNASGDGGGLPIHDHRDNFNGGFAFSIFHPGSSLPQQPWAI